MAPGPMPRPLAERFWEKADKSAGPTGCWLWTGACFPSGYGRFDDSTAHRTAYLLHFGEIDEGLTIDHVKSRGCTNKHCVNPAHLEAVTPRVNVLRSSAPTAINARKTHCLRGHQFTPENTYLKYGRVRVCRACQAQSDRDARMRKKRAA